MASHFAHFSEGLPGLRGLDSAGLMLTGIIVVAVFSSLILLTRSFVIRSALRSLSLLVWTLICGLAWLDEALMNGTGGMSPARLHFQHVTLPIYFLCGATAIVTASTVSRRFHRSRASLRRRRRHGHIG